jgi:hypothetical protein
MRGPGPRKTNSTRELNEMRAIHDLGGLPAGPIDRDEHPPTFLEKRIDALVQLVRDDQRNYFGTDELRRAVESLPKEVYDRGNYYERWILATRALLIERGVLGAEEIEEKLAEVKRRFASAGDEGGR